MSPWVLAARPKTLPAAVVPILVGTACAAAVGEVRWPAGGVALLCALAIQVGANFANDVYDHERGADAGERLGPARMVAAGELSAAAMKRGMWLAFGLAFVAGLYLTWVAGWPLLALGILSIAAGIAYTGGPIPLGYHGLGDLAVIVFFGFVGVCATAYVHLSSVPTLAWWAAVPVGCLAAAILVVNNLRDRAGDAAVGKRTLAVRFGRRGAEVEYALLLLLSYLTPVAIWRMGASAWILAPWLSLPLAVQLMVQVLRREGTALNATLAATAGLLLVFGLLFAAGIVL